MIHALREATLELGAAYDIAARGIKDEHVFVVIRILP